MDDATDIDTATNAHTPQKMIVRHTDVVVIGGSAAGLAGALQLSRQQRSVIIVDAGAPRNAAATHMHSYLGFEGQAPQDLISKAKAEVRSYGGEIIDGRVVAVRRNQHGAFNVSLESGHEIYARRVLIATGLVDVLPQVEHLSDFWGTSVIHCPFCHGFEARDKPMVQILSHPAHLHTVALFHRLTSQLTVVAHNSIDPTDPQLLAFETAGISVIEQGVASVVVNAQGELSAVELHDGTEIPTQVVVVGTKFQVDMEPFADLGITAQQHGSGLGEHLPTNPMGKTAIEGVYAAGNVTDPGQQVLQAAANGSWVGGVIASDLANVNLVEKTAVGGTETDWDERYVGENMWSGAPNETLVKQVSALSPGKVLDVGAGEGGDAVWLRQQGWEVTASDISSRALVKIQRLAEQHQLSVDVLHADANDYQPYPTADFDLVTAHYASIPRTPDHRALHNLISAVAPGGTLLFVSHDLTERTTNHRSCGTNHVFDPHAYVSVDDLLALLSTMSDWQIEEHRTVQRSRTTANMNHHVNDIVLRARRTR